MKSLNNCIVDNCIPTPASCIEWNGGDIEYLGICNGDKLIQVVWEIVDKLKNIAGDDLSKFDIDSLIDICDEKAPNEVNLLSILNIIKNNQICLNDYINSLQETIAELSKENKIEVNLKCFADFDNLGNALAISRDQLDQLIIDNICTQKQKIEYLEGSIIVLQSQIDNINNNTSVSELSISTCIEPLQKPVSSQVVSIANRLCSLEAIVNNLVLNLGLLTSKVDGIDIRLTFIEENCCSANCDDIKLGFTAVFNEDQSGVIIRFTWGAGTSIPVGFIDKGSSGTITDGDGNIISFNIDIPDNFNNNNETEVIISGLSLNSPLALDITAKIGNDTLNCEKCLNKSITPTGCSYCKICNTGTDGDILIVIQGDTNIATNSTPSNTITTTTTTSTTTTTTIV